MSTITDLIRVAGWQESAQEIWQAVGLRESGSQQDNEGTGQDEDVDYQPVNAYLDSFEEWDDENSIVFERYRADLDRWRADPDAVARPDLPALPDAPLLDVALLPIMAVASPPLAAALAVIRVVGRAYLAYRQARLQALAQQDMLEALFKARLVIDGVEKNFTITEILGHLLKAFVTQDCEDVPIGIADFFRRALAYCVPAADGNKDFFTLQDTLQGLIDALSACSVEVETEKAARVRLSGVDTSQGSVPFPTNL